MIEAGTKLINIPYSEIESVNFFEDSVKLKFKSKTIKRKNGDMVYENRDAIVIYSRDFDPSFKKEDIGKKTPSAIATAEFKKWSDKLKKQLSKT